MLTEAREGRFDTIVCWKSDHLSRGVYPAAALMEVVEAYQIGLESVLDAIDMKTFGLMAAIGKIELDNFRERATMGKRGAVKQGESPPADRPTVTASIRWAGPWSTRPRPCAASSVTTWTGASAPSASAGT